MLRFEKERLGICIMVSVGLHISPATVFFRLLLVSQTDALVDFRQKLQKLADWSGGSLV